MTLTKWQPTPLAAEALGCSPQYLKKLRESHGGYLENGRHYSYGTNRNSPITWNVELVRTEINKRGIQARQLVEA